MDNNINTLFSKQTQNDLNEKEIFHNILSRMFGLVPGDVVPEELKQWENLESWMPLFEQYIEGNDGSDDLYKAMIQQVPSSQMLIDWLDNTSLSYNVQVRKDLFFLFKNQETEAALTELLEDYGNDVSSIHTLLDLPVAQFAHCENELIQAMNAIDFQSEQIHREVNDLISEQKEVRKNSNIIGVVIKSLKYYRSKSIIQKMDKEGVSLKNAIISASEKIQAYVHRDSVYNAALSDLSIFLQSVPEIFLQEDHLNTKITKQKSKIVSLRNALERANEDKRNLKDYNDEMLQSWEKEVSILERKLADLENSTSEKYDELLQDSYELSSHYEALMLKFQERGLEIKDLKEEMSEWMLELEDTLKFLEDSEEMGKDELNNWLIKAGDLEHRLSRSLEKNKKLTDENLELSQDKKEAINALEQFQSTIKGVLKSFAQILNIPLDSSAGTIHAALQAQMEESSTLISDLWEKLQQSAVKFEHLQNALRRMTDKNESTQYALENQTIITGVFEEGFQNSQAALRHLEELYNIEIQDHAKTGGNLESAQSRIQNLEKIISKLKNVQVIMSPDNTEGYTVAEYMELHEKNLSLQAQLNELTAWSGSFGNTITGYKQAIAKYNETILAMNIYIAQLEGKNAEKDEDIKKLLADNAILGGALEDTQNELDRVKAEMKRLNKQKTLIIQGDSTFETDFENITLKADLKLLNEYYLSLKLQLENHKVVINKQNKYLDLANKLNVEQAALIKKYELQIKSLKQENRDIKRNNTELQSDLKTSDRIIEQLQQQIKELKNNQGGVFGEGEDMSYFDEVLKRYNQIQQDFDSLKNNFDGLLVMGKSLDTQLVQQEGQADALMKVVGLREDEIQENKDQILSIAKQYEIPTENMEMDDILELIRIQLGDIKTITNTITNTIYVDVPGADVPQSPETEPVTPELKPQYTSVTNDLSGPTYAEKSYLDEYTQEQQKVRALTEKLLYAELEKVIIAYFDKLSKVKYESPKALINAFSYYKTNLKKSFIKVQSLFNEKIKEQSLPIKQAEMKEMCVTYFKTRKHINLVGNYLTKTMEREAQVRVDIWSFFLERREKHYEGRLSDYYTLEAFETDLSTFYNDSLSIKNMTKELQNSADRFNTTTIEELEKEMKSFLHFDVTSLSKIESGMQTFLTDELHKEQSWEPKMEELSGDCEERRVAHVSWEDMQKTLLTARIQQSLEIDAIFG